MPMDKHRAQGGSSVHLTLRILQPSQARLPILRRGTADMPYCWRCQRVDPLSRLSRRCRACKQSVHCSTRAMCHAGNPRIYSVVPSGPVLVFRVTCPYQSVGFCWNVVIRGNDEMPSNGRLPARLNRDENVTSWLAGRGWPRSRSKTTRWAPGYPRFYRAGPCPCAISSHNGVMH